MQLAPRPAGHFFFFLLWCQLMENTCSVVLDKRTHTRVSKLSFPWSGNDVCQVSIIWLQQDRLFSADPLKTGPVIPSSNQLAGLPELFLASQRNRKRPRSLLLKICGNLMKKTKESGKKCHNMNIYIIVIIIIKGPFFQYAPSSSSSASRKQASTLLPSLDY